MNPAYDRIKAVIETHLGTRFTDGTLPLMQAFDEVNNYSLMSGGKRLRPVLLYGVAEAFGADTEDALSLATAIEMIHTYSLVHDDLPAMDDDRYRRGQLTAHAKYGEALAILSGDALLNKAYEVMFERLLVTAHPENFARAAAYISKAAGTDGMVGGQVVDVQTENQPIDQETLDFIIENKTGKLLMAAMVSGAILGGLDSGALDRFTQAAYHIGYSFQLVDDYLDVKGNAQLLGKETGRDLALGKNTYVKYHGPEKTRADATAHLDQALELLDMFEGEHLVFIYDIIEFLKHREK